MSSKQAGEFHVDIMQGFEEVEHTADWAFWVYGCDLRGLFANAARALLSLEGHLAGQAGEVTREVQIEGVDYETLLVNWLNELLYLEQANGEAYDRFEILEIDNSHLRARLHGGPRQDLQTHVKAVTFHNLQVRQGPKGWEATVVVDV